MLGFVIYGALNGYFSCHKLADRINNNDGSVKYSLNDKKLKKPIIAEFVKNMGLIDCFSNTLSSVRITLV